MGQPGEVNSAARCQSNANKGVCHDGRIFYETATFELRKIEVADPDRLEDCNFAKEADS